MKDCFFKYSVGLVFCLIGCLYGCNKTNCGGAAKSYDTVARDEYTTGAVLYQQKAGEYRALCYQAFSIAKTKLDEALKKNYRQPAIICDIDETLLDNSRFQAGLIIANVSYSMQVWNQWVDSEQAVAIPGSVAFLNYANTKHVAIYYVTNRTNDERKHTMNNMHKLGFPQTDTAQYKTHFYFKTGTDIKQYRQDSISHRDSVILYLGDQLTDFPSKFDDLTDTKRKIRVDTLWQLPNNKYIALPNPMYGDWEDAIYNDPDYKLSEDSLRSLRFKALSGFKFH